MNALRVILQRRKGFTLVELMVVVVVLGVLAKIAIPYLSDWRMRAQADEDAKKANIYLLYEAAAEAVSMNHGDYMLTSDDSSDKNATIRWQRPCRQTQVTQLLAHDDNDNDNVIYIAGYNEIESLDEGGYSWGEHQVWNVNDYITHFPVGYAVEIVFAVRDAADEIVEGDNHGPKSHGYHYDRDAAAYDKDRIIIYQFVGDVIDNDYWNTANWDPLQPTDYPYDNLDDNLGPDDWEIVFPENPHHH